MQLLLIHSQGFDWKAKEKAIKNAEPLKDVLAEYKTKESVLVVFVCAEENDSINISQIISQATTEILQALEDIGEKNVILYPWVHLAKKKPAKSDIALKILQSLSTNIKNSNVGVNAIRAPFGYYKSFTIKCKGHALAERSKEIIGIKKPSETEITAEVTTAIEAEDELLSNFYVFTQIGELIPFNDYEFGKFKDLKTFIEYETAKDRKISVPPKHVEFMKKLELVDYEEGSDAGNFRILPRGYIVKQLIEDHVIDMAAQYGAMIVETPLMYSYDHPSLKKYLERFPARQYVVKSGKQDFFLRFSACFGQFLTMSDAIISYRQLPLKVFEMAKSFRREQRGELAGIRRLRAFTMPDLHTVAIDMQMAKKEFEAQYRLAKQYMEDIEVSYETAFRMTKDFFDENKNWIISLISELEKPILLELFEKRYAYFILKFEFNIVDDQNKAAALSTVQIDVENAERFDIKYIDNQGEEKRPFLLHCSLSGSSERVIYGILEDQLKKAKKGTKPTLPLWLSPAQVRILPVVKDFISYSKSIAHILEKNNIRVEIDDRDLSLSKKIRSAEKLWTPLIIVVGEKEMKQKMVNVRYRIDRQQKQQTLEEVIKYVKTHIDQKPFFPRIFPELISKQPIFTRVV